MAFPTKVVPFSQACKTWLNNTYAPKIHYHDDRYSKLGHTHPDSIAGNMPDFSRSKSLGAQEVWKSRTSECYKEPGTNNTVTGGCPYVLKIKHPCYVILQFQDVSKATGDSEWGMWWGTNYRHVCALNQADDNNTGTAIRKMTDANGFSGLSYGVNFFTFFRICDNIETAGTIALPMTNTDWYYRPYIGSGGSRNEAWESFDFKLIPMLGTPSGTLLVERYMFTADNSVSSILNSNVTLGTMSGNNNVMTYYNKDSNPTESMSITRPGKFYA